MPLRGQLSCQDFEQQSCFQATRGDHMFQIGCYFEEKKNNSFRRRLIVKLRCPVINESVLRVVVLVQGKSHSPSSHPNYNQTKRAITLK